MIDTQKRVVVLDRDGVINVDIPGRYVCSVAEWVAIDGSLQAMARLSQAGFSIYVVSNQSGIGRGLFTEADLAAMHEKMLRELRMHGGEVSGLFYCPHVPDAGCHCRKPATGLLEDVSNAAAVALRGVAFIGDKWSDMLAARSMRMRAMLVATGHGRAELSAHASEVDEYFADLRAAADALISGAVGEHR